MHKSKPMQVEYAFIKTVSITHNVVLQRKVQIARHSCEKKNALTDCEISSVFFSKRTEIFITY